MAADSVHAGCTAPDENLSITCSGDLDSSIVYDDGTVTSVTIENLTSSDTQVDVVSLTTVGTFEGYEQSIFDNSIYAVYGSDGADLSVLSELTTGIPLSGEENVFYLSSTGKTGDSPGSTSAGGSATYGYDATDGGAGGALTFDMYGDQTLFSFGSGVLGLSYGADGGAGGGATATTFNAHGGVGGDGGDGGMITNTQSDGSNLFVYTATGYGVTAISSGGDGGDGGYADAGGNADGYGGGAGTGGAGGDIVVLSTTSNNLIDTFQNNGHAVLGFSFSTTTGGTGGSG